MAPPRTYRCDALTLKTLPFEESGLLVTAYSREYGKLRAIAKNARKPTSRLVGHLEPLTLARLALARGRNLDLIQQAQTLDALPALKGDLAAISQGLYVAELLDGFGSEANPNPPLFQLAADTLQALPAGPAELPLRYFDLHLLRLNGLLPELYQCVECRRPVEQERHQFNPSLGGVLCLDCPAADADAPGRPLSLRALKVLRLLHRGELAEAAALTLPPPLAEELRTLLASAVRYWLGREIRANSFLRQLRNESAAAVI